MIRYCTAFATLLCFAQGVSAPYIYSSANQQRHTEVVMRMIGHQVLLTVGDSTSIVLPLAKNENQYTIRFGSEFRFLPDALALTIDSVIEATGISQHFIVEFVNCQTKQVVHSYEISEAADVLACQGRAQPLACYELWISLLDTPTLVTEEPLISTPITEGKSRNDRALVLLFLASALAVLGILFIRWRRRTKRAIDPNEIQLGAFIFKKKSMELLFKDERIALTGKESELLQLLSASVNHTVEREDILKAVWGDDGDYVGRTLDVFISKLRKKLEHDSTVRIINIRGIGYKLVLGD